MAVTGNATTAIQSIIQKVTDYGVIGTTVLKEFVLLILIMSLKNSKWPYPVF
jgi:hypothetical protein